jgi:hypothetical protein
MCASLVFSQSHNSRSQDMNKNIEYIFGLSGEMRSHNDEHRAEFYIQIQYNAQY